MSGRWREFLRKKLNLFTCVSTSDKVGPGGSGEAVFTRPQLPASRSANRRRSVHLTTELLSRPNMSTHLGRPLVDSEVGWPRPWLVVRLCMSTGQEAATGGRVSCAHTGGLHSARVCHAILASDMRRVIAPHSGPRTRVVWSSVVLASDSGGAGPWCTPGRQTRDPPSSTHPASFTLKREVSRQMVTSLVQDGLHFAVPDIGALLLLIHLETVGHPVVVFCHFWKNGSRKSFFDSFSCNSENSGNLGLLRRTLVAAIPNYFRSSLLLWKDRAQCASEYDCEDVRSGFEGMTPHIIVRTVNPCEI